MGRRLTMSLVMRARFACLVLAAIFLMLPIAAGSGPAFAQTDANFEISLGYFASRLEPFGHWINHPVWGDVWQPDAGRNFRPYFYGYWEYTSDAGWLWVSNEPYGDIVYHYGRWIYDPALGWLWVPGYVWAPSWVVWRQGEDYVGWLPMPPAYNDLQFDKAPVASYAPEASYGYQYVYGSSFASDAFFNLWIFTQINDFGRSDRRHYLVDHDRQRDLFRRTRDCTRYENEHDHVVDRSIDPEWVQRLTNRTLSGESVHRFLRRNVPMETVSQGQEIFRHGREAERLRSNASATPAVGDAAGLNGGAGSGKAGGLNNPLPGRERDRQNGGFGRNPIAGLGPAPTPGGSSLAPAGGALASGQPMPGSFFGNGLPGSRMRVVRGIGPSTDGSIPPPGAAIGAIPQPGPAPFGAIAPLNVPRVARVPVGAQPQALGIPHAPGQAMAPVVAPPMPVMAAPAPAVAAPAPAPALAPSAPASAPRVGGFGQFGGR